LSGGAINNLPYYQYPISKILPTGLLEQWIENDLSGRINPCGYVCLIQASFIFKNGYSKK